MPQKPLRVVIVGAGFAGLTAAIECKLRGMEPVVVEAYSGPSQMGDLLDFVRNAGRVFESWDNGNVARRMGATGVNKAKDLEFYNADDDFLRSDPWPQGSDFLYVYAGHRGTFHRIVYEYAVEIGVELQVNKRVVQYLDDDNERGVIVAGGERILGDVVLACDGPKSLAREHLLGLEESKVNSGYAIFRAFFNITPELLLEHPALNDMILNGEDTVRCWVGRDMHGFIYVWNDGKYEKTPLPTQSATLTDSSFRDCAWVLTHKDDADIEETWSERTSKAEVQRYLDAASFPDVWRHVLQATPDDRLVDYKLVWRDPLTTWLSPSRKSAVLGDAAHCHLPTSAQGACQAVEDAAVVALCLEKAQGDVELGLQVFERIRFNRSHIIHQASISTRNIYHNQDWTPELIKVHPDSLTIPIYDWITEYNVYEEVEKNFDLLAEDVRTGKKGSIEDLALPAGGDYEAMVLKGL